MAAPEYDERILATHVSVDVEMHTADFKVHSVHFAFRAGDEEQVLSIQRSFEDDDGVCLVLSPSQQCAYDAFTELKLARDSLSMRFTPKGEGVFDVSSLRVEFSADDDLWSSVRRALTTICEGKAFYVTPEAA